MADKLLGSFVWCELLTTDSAAAESFYKKVVGWTSVAFAPDGSYTVFNNPSGAGRMTQRSGDEGEVLDMQWPNRREVPAVGCGDRVGEQALRNHRH